MHIVGGLYREQCCVPAWDAIFGSGGRAAAALSALSPGSVLYTYTEDFESDAVVSLKKLGIGMLLKSRPTSIVFSYFHPLSRPHILPPLHKIERQPIIKVNGDAVLRFGFLEGDAVVDARRAVFDPQTWRAPVSFSDNGSRAEELAVVLNELELRSITRLDDLNEAAIHLIQNQDAEVVIAKGGVRGATVFVRGKQPISIPPYRSSRVFKTGTGDVFSAIFAYYWAEKELSAGDAADIASRSVATYCNSGRLPLAESELLHAMPIKISQLGLVLLEGTIDTLGQRYTMEEARFMLGELGVEVICPSLESNLNAAPDAMLVLGDGLNDETIKRIENMAVEMPIVVLQEGRVQNVGRLANGGNVTTVDDFSSALYFAAWVAAERASNK